MKDNFSHSSDKYLQFRPVYPEDLYDFLLSKVRARERAWDCGTGNGQVAASLSPHFNEVYATDISENQIIHAIKKNNIFYSVEDSANASFPSDFFDLIVVAQAIHWFDFKAFYKQVAHVANPGAVFAAVGYGLLQVNKLADAVTRHFYEDVTGPYWDAERRYIDENYQTIPFPFEEFAAPEMKIETQWKLEHLIGFLRTWSAVRHYELSTGSDPLLFIQSELSNIWGKEEVKSVTFPIFIRAGTVCK
ncbi:MAG: class I SAM-dependent methyltransferase [Chitinophagaceae bacterium]|nr:MAG: class I SAM-dependent methyltransferase [Chitinophagaceae bacterium]